MQIKWIIGAVAVGVAQPALAQSAIDRVDPALIERDRLPVLPKPAKDAPAVMRAAPQPSVNTASEIELGAITLSGLAGLVPADFADIFARYIGRSVSSAELSRLAEEISARARGKGYVFASASIDPQRLTTGVLIVRYDPGVLDDIRIEGGDNAAVRDALAPLLGKPAQMRQVERRLLLAGDIDGVAIRRSQFVRDGSRGVLVVTIAQTATRVRAVLDNDSSAPIGPEQLRLDASLNGVLAKDDVLAVTYVATPFEPDELQYIRGRYAKRVSRDGTEVSIGASVSSSRPGDYLDALDIRGQSWSANIGLLQPLLRRRNGSLWFGANLDVRDSRQFRSGRLRRHDRIFAMRASVYGNATAVGGTVRGNLTLSHGLDGLGATGAGDPLASRDDSDSDFTHVVGWGDWTRPVGDGFSLRLAAQGQLASGPLLIAEEIGLGGAAFLRGYDYSERSGDEGYMGSAELRYDWRNPLGLGRKAQVYGFVDGGRVTNLADGYGGGALTSGGGGIRADVSPSIDANVEVAVPLSGPRYETGTHEPRINLRVLKVF
ncbi:MAG: ShlB/FhaC/HecB family hemolysin secretion/activation protein [Pseudomonadota bacterium]